MGWLSSISSVFSSNKAIDNVLDKNSGLLVKTGEWIGNMNFTEEEKAEMNKGLINSWSDFVQKTMGESTIRSKSRRSIAMLWIRYHLALIFGTCVVAYYDQSLASFYFSVAFSPLLVIGTFTVIAFFFGSHAISAHLSSVINKLRP